MVLFQVPYPPYAPSPNDLRFSTWIVLCGYLVLASLVTLWAVLDADEGRPVDGHRCPDPTSVGLS
jgi:hypothetical protein